MQLGRVLHPIRLKSCEPTFFQGRSSFTDSFSWYHGAPQHTVFPETVWRNDTTWLHRNDGDRSHQAFQIIGVPEPATWQFIAAGGVVVIQRRKRPAAREAAGLS